MLSRRDFFNRMATYASAVSAASCQQPLPWERFSVTSNLAQTKAAHLIRSFIGKPHSRSTQTLTVDVCIVGAGAAGLTAAWWLDKLGCKDVAVLAGPELFGNTAGHTLANMPCPTGAHYLPLPSAESTHVRKILKAMGVIESDPSLAAPRFDERYIVHAPADRLLVDSVWENGLLPANHADPQSKAQQTQFLKLVAHYSDLKGVDGKRAFAVPIVQSSSDPAITQFDSLNFQAWLDASGLNAKPLLWYLDYCCRDEYGAGLQHISAWAGLHYFCSRSGRASNAQSGAVLTWPDGLAQVSQFLAAPVHQRKQVLAASAVYIERFSGGANVHALKNEFGSDPTPMIVKARKVIVATPLFVAGLIDPEIALAFPNWRQLLPEYRPWLVANFQLARPLRERNSELAWDNVVYQSSGLGFVNDSHQHIRVSPQRPLTLTSYNALASMTPKAGRLWLQNASEPELLALAAHDLKAAYGERFWAHVEHVHLTARGHGMVSPAPGFLSNRITNDLRREQGAVQYACADLSGYSVFEEAAWWGSQCAERCAG